MTVKQLIRELKEHDPSAVVAWKDQDHGAGEFNGVVRSVFVNDGETWGITKAMGESERDVAERAEASRRVGVFLSS